MSRPLLLMLLMLACVNSQFLLPSHKHDAKLQAIAAADAKFVCSACKNAAFANIAAIKIWSGCSTKTFNSFTVNCGINFMGSANTEYRKMCINRTKENCKVI